jgi:hypothetical protein
MPRNAVSSEMSPSSPSLLIFFQSLKCSHSLVMLPTFVALPLDSRITALSQKIWGMVSL